MLTITVKYNNENYIFNKGASLLEISESFQKNFKDKIIVGEVNGVIKDLNTNILSN